MTPGENTLEELEKQKEKLTSQRSMLQTHPNWSFEARERAVAMIDEEIALLDAKLKQLKQP